MTKYPASAPEELVHEFEELCRRMQWTRDEILELLLEYAVREGSSLALQVHKNRLRRARGKKWQPPSTDF